MLNEFVLLCMLKINMDHGSWLSTIMNEKITKNLPSLMPCFAELDMEVTWK